MGNPWDALLAPQQPTDGYRNPDFDQAYGLDEKSGDSDAVKFSKGLSSAMMRNSPEGRQSMADIAKAKMAAQVQMQLMKAKIDLEHQYPEYKSFQTPWGGVVSVNPYDPNDIRSFEPVSGAKDAYQSGLAAKKAKDDYEASPDYIKSLKDKQTADIDKSKAEAEAYKALPGYRAAQAGARAEGAAIRDRGPPPTREETKKEVYTELGIDPSKPYMNEPDQLIKASQMVDDRYNKRLAAWRSGAPTGVAAPTAPSAAGGQPPPDLSNIFNLNDDNSL